MRNYALTLSVLTIAISAIIGFGAQSAQASTCTSDPIDANQPYTLSDGDVISAYICPGNGNWDDDFFELTADYTEDVIVEVINNSTNDALQIDVTNGAEETVVILPGDSYTFEYAPLEQSTYELQIGNRYSGAAEINYDLNVSIQAVSGYDLAITDAYYDESTEKLHYTVMNRGDSDVDPNTAGGTIQIFLDGALLNEHWWHLMYASDPNLTNFLNAGEIAEKTLYLPRFSAYQSMNFAEHSVDIIIDNRNRVTEVNEGNNSDSITFVQPCQHSDPFNDVTLNDGDNLVTSLCSREGNGQDIDYYEFFADFTEDVSLEIINNGNRTINVFINIDAHNGWGNIETEFINVLPGTSQTFTHEPAEATDYTVTVGNNARGINEHQYGLNLEINTVSGADLAIIDPYFDETTEKLHYTLVNRGDTNIDPNTAGGTIRIDLNGISLNEHWWHLMYASDPNYTVFLNAGETMEKTLYLPRFSNYQNLLMAEHTLEVFVDPRSQVTEQHEDNNSTSLDFIPLCRYPDEADRTIQDGDIVISSICTRDAEAPGDDQDSYYVNLQAGDTLTVQFANNGSESLMAGLWGDNIGTSRQIFPNSTYTFIGTVNSDVQLEIYLSTYSGNVAIREIPYTFGITVN